MFIRVLILILVVGIVGCGGSHDSYDANPTVEAPLDTPEAPGFADVTAVFQRNRCLQCHSVAGGNVDGINLETVDRVRALSALVVSAIESGRMPRGGPRVDEADVAIVRAWVDSPATP